MRVIRKYSVSAEENNELLIKGFKWLCEGDYEIAEGTDPWSGLPNLNWTVNYFNSYAEAERFAKAQTHPLFPSYRFKVDEVQHKETLAESNAKKEAAKQKRAKTEQNKAEALGFTVKEYRRYKYLKGKVNSSLPDEITRLERELAKAKRSLAHYKKEFTELENKKREM